MLYAQYYSIIRYNDLLYGLYNKYKTILNDLLTRQRAGFIIRARLTDKMSHLIARTLMRGWDSIAKGRDCIVRRRDEHVRANGAKGGRKTFVSTRAA